MDAAPRPYLPPVPRARGRTWLVLALVVSTGIAVSGCGPGSGTPTVLVVGDSLLAQSSEQTQAALQAAGWNPVIDAHSGATIIGGYQGDFVWTTEIRNLVEVSRSDVVVVELGTNGCGCDNTLAAADDLMRAIGDVNLVVWVTIRPHPDDQDRTDDMNSVILSTAQRWPNLELLDMNGYFEGSTDWVGIDGVHFTDAGEAAFAQMIADFVSKAD